MRALFKTLFAALCLTLLISAGDVLIGSRKFLEQPRIHVVQEGEYFSKLAADYYGNAGYWRALALINRAPNVDRIYPGEHILLPDAATVAKIARAQRLSEVNQLVSNQEAVATLEPDTRPKAEPPIPTEPVNVSESASGTPSQDGAEAVQTPISETEQLAEATAAKAADETLEQMIAEVHAAAEQPASPPSKWWLPVGAVSGLLLLGVGYIYHRRRKQAKQLQEPELDATPIDAFILDDDSKDMPASSLEATAASPATDDIFSPVRRRDPGKMEPVA